MRRDDFSKPDGLRPQRQPDSNPPHDSGGFRNSVSGDGRGDLRTSLPWMDGLIHASGRTDESPWSLSRGGQRASGTGSADGGDLRARRGPSADGGPAFDAAVAPGGYRWWYIDAVSDDGDFSLTVIAFIGSVFSPYYAWSNWADPYRHCAVNVALYGPRGARWAMTERSGASLRQSPDTLAIGPSSLQWRDGALAIRLDEIAAPIPKRIRGEIVVEPQAINRLAFTLEAAGAHHWRPIAPVARVKVKLQTPDLAWSGHAYVDTNAGDEPLEKAFASWTWSRARIGDSAAIFYDAERRREPALSLALRVNAAGDVEEMEPPPVAALPKTKWLLSRRTRAQDGAAGVLRDFEDTPFYSRSLVASHMDGAPVEWVHESLSLDRFANPIVRLMLPFRMPRRG